MQEKEESKMNRNYEALCDYLNLQETRAKVSNHKEISHNLRSEVDVMRKNKAKLEEKLCLCKRKLKVKELDWVDMKAAKEASEAALYGHQEALEENNALMNKNNELTLKVSMLELKIEERNDWKARCEDEEKKTKVLNKKLKHSNESHDFLAKQLGKEVVEMKKKGKQRR